MISLLVVVLAAAMVLTNVDDEYVPERVEVAVRALVQGVGLDQNWGVFAPNPRRISRGMYAVITYDDGSRVGWETPTGDRVVGAYRSYRWRKWMTKVVLDRNAGRYWERTARWLAEVHERDGRVVTRVDLVRRWQDVPPPGEPDPPWQEHAFYTLDLT